jgi:hypothetical protein
MEKKRVTTKIWQESLRKLKIIAAIQSETMIETLARLIDAQYERVQKEQPHEGGTRVQNGA